MPAEIGSVVFSAFIHSLDHICTACAQPEEFSLLHEFELSGTLRTAPLKHDLGICEFSTKSTLGVVSFLRSPSGGGRTLPGHEGLSASLVSESVVCIMGFGATGILAGRRAIVAPRECTHSIFLLVIRFMFAYTNTRGSLEIEAGPLLSFRWNAAKSACHSLPAKLFVHIDQSLQNDFVDSQRATKLRY